MVICVDFDDVINDLLSAWLLWLNTKYNCNVAFEDVVHWDMARAYTSLTREQIYEPLMNESFWGTVKIKNEAIDIIKKLQAEGHEIYICTSTHPIIMSCKYNKLMKPHLPFIDERHIILAHNKQMVNCDIFIDDNPNNLLGGNYKKILFDMPHNRNVVSDEVVRVKDWDEIYNAVNDMIKQNS